MARCHTKEPPDAKIIFPFVADFEIIR